MEIRKELFSVNGKEQEQLTIGISLKVFRIDRILEGKLGVQEYKNSVNPGSHNLEGYL